MRTSYLTSFSKTETPIFEGGNWVGSGFGGFNTAVAVSGNLAFATQVDNGNFNDSISFLTGGFPANQRASGTIHLTGSGITGGAAQEVEILLRASISSSGDSIHYECNLAYNGAYAGVVRLNGDGTFIQGPTVAPGAFADGSVFTAQIVGSVVTTFLNGVQLQQLDMLTTFNTKPLIASGCPGMGFFRDAQGGTTTPNAYCLSQWQALSLQPTPWFGG